MSQNTKASTIAWIFVAAVGLFAGCYLMMGMVGRPDAEGSFKLEEFGRLPVVDHGRIKPIDTLARVSLMVLSGRQEYKDEKGETQPATRWLLEIMTAPQKQEPSAESPIPGNSGDVKAYRIENEALRQDLGLDKEEGVLFSFAELYKLAGPERFKRLFEKAAQLGHPDLPSLGEDDRALAELALQVRGHVEFAMFETPYKVFRIDNDEVLALLGLESREGFRYGIDEFLPRVGFLEREARRANRLKAKDRSVYDQKALELFKRIEMYFGLAAGRAETLHLVAPAFKGDDWKVLPDAREAMKAADRKNPEALAAHTPTIAFDAMLITYARNEPKQFNQVLDRYQKLVADVLPTESATAALETGFNEFAPFYRCSVLYVIVFLIACVSWLWPNAVINRFGFWMMVLVLLVHTWALVARMWIQARPPVTNLYSSAVFIGWGCVIFCVFLEWRFRNALATAIAGLTGFSTLLIAHYLGGSGDTMEMMQAVLDTNFWLATHVTTVTIGYSATFIAGAFGMLYVWMMLVTAILNGLKEGGHLSAGRGFVFLLASLAVTILAAGVTAGVLYGLWYLARRDPTVGLLVRGLSGLLLVGAVGFAIYLLVVRVRNRLTPDKAEVPASAHWLEKFAFTDDSRKVVTWMIYGTICFATLFSFVGTVLGGIWADQSWGRFWGWDPKENGALLIVIMNALILHARWGGMIKDRGMATLTLVGNMITMWSWFGTNQLGIGLHAYGFNNALVLLCRWFWVSQMVLIGLAMLPLQNWQSYTPRLTEFVESPTARAPRLKGKRGAGIQPA